MKNSYILLVLIASFFCSCSAKKTSTTPEQIETLNRLVDSRSFAIESDWALPFVTSSMIAVQNSGLMAPGNTANRIRLLDQPNLLTIKTDSIHAELPYFGEVQMPSGYMGSKDNAIVFEGDLKNYEVIHNEDSSYTLTFNAKSYSENFKVIINLLPNLKTKITLRGANRFPIQYSGRIVAMQ